MEIMEPSLLPSLFLALSHSLQPSIIIEDTRVCAYRLFPCVSAPIGGSSALDGLTQNTVRKRGGRGFAGTTAPLLSACPLSTSSTIIQVDSGQGQPREQCHDNIIFT